MESKSSLVLDELNKFIQKSVLQLKIYYESK